jgi:hypothetical protein
MTAHLKQGQSGRAGAGGARLCGLPDSCVNSPDLNNPLMDHDFRLIRQIQIIHSKKLPKNY